MCLVQLFVVRKVNLLLLRDCARSQLVSFLLGSHRGHRFPFFPCTATELRVLLVQPLLEVSTLLPGRCTRGSAIRTWNASLLDFSSIFHQPVFNSTLIRTYSAHQYVNICM